MDAAPTDFLDHGRNIGISGRLDLDEAQREAGLGAIQIDSLKEDEVEMEIEIEGTAETLDKGHRSRLDVGPLDTSGSAYHEAPRRRARPGQASWLRSRGGS